ncbi:hypothetical protein B0H34DRAFT_452448 [Crassisporium funariophilum]|nr:hypothetical protein B0H34DRAFT_452448 [Crassisporium funariophilum]
MLNERPNYPEIREQNSPVTWDWRYVGLVCCCAMEGVDAGQNRMKWAVKAPVNASCRAIKGKWYTTLHHRLVQVFPQPRAQFGAWRTLTQVCCSGHVILSIHTHSIFHSHSYLSPFSQIIHALQSQPEHGAHPFPPHSGNTRLSSLIWFPFRQSLLGGISL